ncbi:MAG: tetratricopeptide repeat protein, partial [Microvirga sp.]
MTNAHLFHRIFFLLLLFTSSVSAQVANRPTSEIFNEIDRYESEQRKALSSSGKRYDNAAKENVQNDRRALAKKYALEIEGRPNISGNDFYYLARIYSSAENDKKTLEIMQRYVAEVPEDARGEMIKSALSFIVVLASRDKQLEAAEKAYQRFVTAEPIIPAQRPALQDYLASAYFKDGKYEQAIGHAQSAFDLLKTLTAKSVS